MGFIIALFLLVVTVVLFIGRMVMKKREKNLPLVVVAIPLAIALVLTGASSIYTQDVGEVTVLKNWGGSLAGHNADAGFNLKAPWQNTVKYDVRNNVLSFMGDSEKDQFEGGSANGSAVTINDAGGAKATIDIQVNYSLDPSAAEELYTNYGSQENFVKSICAVDIRSVPREVSGKFDTISILTARGEFTNAIEKALTKKWEKYGLVIEQVSVQNVVYPKSIVQKYEEAQAAEIAEATARNQQDVAKVEAETKRIEAEGTAKANEILTNSLSDEVLQQNYIDALISVGKNGNLVVVPEGSTPMVNTGK
jgi:regulator of protease activity HflC (stomatin/prohibitin superfamily)